MAGRSQKRKESQKDRPAVKCEEKDLENIFKFKFLGSIFVVDGSHDQDVNRRHIIHPTHTHRPSTFLRQSNNISGSDLSTFYTQKETGSSKLISVYNSKRGTY